MICKCYVFRRKSFAVDNGARWQRKVVSNKVRSTSGQSAREGCYQKERKDRKSARRKAPAQIAFVKTLEPGDLEFGQACALYGGRGIVG